MDLELYNASSNPDHDLLSQLGNSLLSPEPARPSKSMSFQSMNRGDDAYRALAANDAQSLDHGSRVNLVRKAIEELQSDLGIATRLVEAIGTKRDTPEQRTKMSGSIERCALAARSINEQLERLEGGPTADRQKKQIKQKLQADFMKLRADFQHISTLAKQRLAQATQASKAAAPSSASTRGGRFNADDEERSLLNDAVARERTERERQESLQMQQEVTYNTARILEQQQQFQNVERDVKQIEEIFKDLSMLVQEQGIQIDNIEQNIVNSRDNAKAANENIVEANEYQKSARAKMCWVALCFAIIALVLVLWLTNSF